MPLIKSLSGRGAEILTTTREYREVNQLLEIRKVSAIKIGRHGGGILKNKLISSAERTRQLALLLSKRRCDFALSFSSPEAARVAYGLSVPHYCVSDSPHAEAASRLTIPLSKMLFTPKVIPKSAWSRYGIGKDRIVQYDALDPVVWLRGFKPNPRVLDELGLDYSLPIITIRPEETQASYLLDYGTHVIRLVSLVRALRQELSRSQVVLLPRYDAIRSTKKLMGESVIVADRVVDATSLLSYSRLFLGGGGTMTAESALLGVPTVSFYPAPPTYVDESLIKLGFIKRIRNIKGIVKHAVRMFSDDSYGEVLKVRARRLLSRMDDPIAVIEKHLVRFR
jgi:predicted glycosyltransferase